jgi:hypothetical protein
MTASALHEAIVDNPLCNLHSAALIALHVGMPPQALKTSVHVLFAPVRIVLRPSLTAVRRGYERLRVPTSIAPYIDQILTTRVGREWCHPLQAPTR